MTTIGFIGDIHMADRPPSFRAPSYPQDILAKLKNAHELLKMAGTTHNVWIGDVFHSKTPSRVSHRSVSSLIEIGQAYPKWWIVPGNHDMANDRIESIEDQPLGVLYKAGAGRLSGIRDLGDVRVLGIPYVEGKALLEYIPESGTADLVACHLPIMPPGRSAPFEYIDAAELAERVHHLGVSGVFYGHIHDNHGIFAAGGISFCNHGALSRGSIHESDLTRRPAATTWSREAGFQRIEIPHRPVSEVFIIPERSDKDLTTKSQVEDFLAKISTTNFETISIEGLIEEIRHDEQIDLPVRKVMIGLLEQAG